MNCKYCGSRYSEERHDFKCPNCGAPAVAEPEKPVEYAQIETVEFPVLGATVGATTGLRVSLIAATVFAVGSLLASVATAVVG